MAGSEPATINIDDAGDVVLAVGEPVKARLRVSSAVLSRASNVFAALFSPRYVDYIRAYFGYTLTSRRLSSSYSERHNLGTSGEPKLIQMPDDEPAAITDLLLLLHGEEVILFSKGTASPDHILSFAVATDKYDCSKALRLQSQGILLAWLDSNPKQRDNGVDESKIMAAAYLLEHRRTFSIITQRLMQTWNGEFKQLLTKELRQMLPMNALCMLAICPISKMHSAHKPQSISRRDVP